MSSSFSPSCLIPQVAQFDAVDAPQDLNLHAWITETFKPILIGVFAVCRYVDIMDLVARVTWQRDRPSQTTKVLTEAISDSIQNICIEAPEATDHNFFVNCVQFFEAHPTRLWEGRLPRSRQHPMRSNARALGLR